MNAAEDVPYFMPSKVLTLNDFRSTLIRLEETIIFAMIERAQFSQNLRVYNIGEE